MVEINNQRKAFLDMLAWSEGTDNGRQKTRKSWLWRHCRRRAIYWLLRSPLKTCHAKPKTQINRRRTLPASSRWWDAYRKQLGLKDFSPKSQDAVALGQIKERGALPMINGISVRQSTVAAISGLHCRALVMVSLEHKADSLISQNLKKRARNGQRDWCMSRVTAIISALVICIIVYSSWAVNHYREECHYLQSPAQTKMPENLPRTRHHRHADASAWCCRARCKYTKKLADAKAGKWCSAYDAAAGRRRLHIKAVCQSVREVTTASGVDNAASPGLARHRWIGIISPERLIIMQKQLEGTQKYINRAVQIELPISMGNSCNYCEQYTRASSGV